MIRRLCFSLIRFIVYIFFYIVISLDKDTTAKGEGKSIILKFTIIREICIFADVDH